MTIDRAPVLGVALVAALMVAMSAFPAETTIPPKSKGYYPDLHRPLFLDQGTLICRDRITLELAMRQGSGAVSRADAPTCMNMPATKRVRILGYSTGSGPALVHISITDPPHGSVQGWTALRWLDDHADCAPGRMGCD